MSVGEHRFVGQGCPVFGEPTMESACDSLQVYVLECVATVRVCGRGTMANSPLLRQFVKQHLATAGPRAIVHVELRACAYMDSTFVGTLLCLKREAARAGGEFTLVNVSAASLQLLGQLGMSGVFTITEASPVPENDCTTLTESHANPCCRTTVLSAHQELACLPGPAGERFRTVAEGLARDLAAETRPAT